MHEGVRLSQRQIPMQEFLTQLKRIKDDELIRLKRETSVIQDDMNQVESLLNNIKQLKIEDGNPSGISDEEKHQKVQIKNGSFV